MGMTSQKLDDVVVLAPTHELYEGGECDEMERALLEHAERGARVIVDLSRVRRISAHCLGILAHAQQIAAQNGGRIVLCGVTHVHHWVIRRAGLGDVLSVFEDRASSIHELTPRPRAVA
jgi:anti-anti-sigma factor